MKLITTRDITNDECEWIEETIPAGTIVYSFHEQTYGCVDQKNGLAVSLIKNEYPFFELPHDAIKEIT